MHKRLKILHLEDVAFDAELVAREVRKGGLQCDIKTVDRGLDFKQALEEFSPDIILSDHSLPSFSSFDALEIVRKTRPHVPFILVTGTMSDEFAVEAMKLGIDDYVVKERLQRLPVVIKSALQKLELKLENERSKKQIEFDRRNLDALINSMDGVMWSVDKDLRLVTANRAFINNVKAATGVDVVLGDYMVINEGYPAELARQWRLWYNQALDGDTFNVQHYEPTVQIWADTAFNPIFENGEVIGVACFTRDITRAKQQERKILEQNHVLEEKRTILEKLTLDLTRIMDSSMDVICSFDAEGRFVDVSAACYKVWGYKAAELIGRKYVDFVDPEHIQATVESVAEVQSGVEKTHFENIYIKKDGSKVPIIWSAKWDAEREVMYCIARDATVLKQAEAEKIKSQQLFQSLIQHGADMIAIISKEGCYKFVSSNVEPILGYPAGSYIGRSAFELIHPDDLPRVKQALQQLLLSGSADIADFRFKHADGSWRWIETSGSNNLNNPAINGIIINSRDITDRKLAALKLRESNDRYNLAAQATNDVIWDLNLLDNTYYKSGNFAKLFGYHEDDDTTFREWSNRLHPEDKERIINYMQVLFDNGQDTWEDEYRFIRADGSIANVYDRTFILRDDSGKPIRMVGAMQDITRLKETELRLKESNERYYFAAQATNDVIWDWNFEQNTYYRSQNFKKLFGYDANALSSRVGWEDALHPKDKPRVLSRLNDFLQSRQTLWEDNYRLLKDNGTIAFVEDRGHLVRDEEGSPLRMVGAMRDVTLRKEMEIKLSESNERYNLVSLATNDVIWDWDLIDGNHYWGENLFSKFGFTAADFETAEKWASHIHPDDQQRALQKFLNYVESPMGSWEDEYRLIKPDGEIAHIYDRGSVMFDASGKATRILGAMQDVTLRKIAEEQKLQAAQQLKKALEVQLSIMNALPAHIALLDQHGVIVEVNEAWKRFAHENGLSDDHFGIGVNYLDVCSQASGMWIEDAKSAAIGIRNVINGVVSEYRQEYSCHSPTEKRWFNLIASPLHSEKQGAVVMHINISEAREAQARLMASEANLQTIFENTEVAYTLLDQDMNIIAFNAQASALVEQVFGSALKLNTNYYNYFKEEKDKAGAFEIMQHVLGGQSFNYETSRPTQEGEKWYSVSIIPMQLRNKLTGICIATTDISSRKLAELERERMLDDIIKRNQHLQQFTYIVSHNLRAPVAKLAAFSEELKDDTYDESTKKLFINELSLSVNKLDEVIKDLNDILQVNKVADAPREKVNLTELLYDVKISISNIINDFDNVEIRSDFSKVPEMVGLRSYMYSIFYNLISNSLKYHDPARPLILSIHSSKDSDGLKLVFEDNGLGIDLEKMGDKVFGLYKRFHQHVEGKGMGLFMTKAQVENLGGKIEVQSEVNKGTRFIITFNK